MRYAGEHPLPPYAFVPGGEHPHPTRDPAGHAHRAPPVPLASAFAWGVDLYNHGYFWEAHEAWEDPWRAAPPGSAEAELLRGLIQCAAACLKLRAGRREAAQRIGARARAHLQQASEGHAAARGLDLRRFVRRFAAWVEAEPVDPEAYPRIELSVSAA